MSNYKVISDKNKKIEFVDYANNLLKLSNKEGHSFNEKRLMKLLF